MILNIKKIEVATARRGKTFREIYREAHISPVTAGRIRKGYAVQPRTAGKLASALNCDVTELIQDGQ